MAGNAPPDKQEAKTAMQPPEDHPNSVFSKLIVELNVSKIRTQRHQIRLNPSPEGTLSKKRRREKEKKRRKRLLLDHRRSPLDNRKMPEFSRITARRRSSAGSPPDAGVLPDHRLTAEFCRSSTRRRSSAGLQRDAGVPPDYHPMPDFCQTTTHHQSSTVPQPDVGVPPDHLLTSKFRWTAAQRWSSSRLPIEVRLQFVIRFQADVLAPQEEVFLPRDPPLAEGVQLKHLHAEIPLPPPKRYPQSHQDNELADTTSSTHPSYIGRQPRIPPDLPEDLAQPHIAEIPRNALRHEL
ncbi:hypothetical protein M5K25_008720 [Dendrobium thyrsiflorum]|uniref:Uncharacterized protein n=1 Tax=Dendrobium thyrsiflorum TaxID=117978 RepID=A0ABD0VGK3_DENTH